MNRYDRMLEQLASAARVAANDEPSASLSPGLSDRVLPLARASRDPAWLWELFAVRALPVAVAALLLCLWLAPRPSVDPSGSDAIADAIFTEVLAP